MDDPAGRAALVRHFDRYAAVAVADGVGIVLETPTWRASPDWAARQEIDETGLVRLNHEAVALLQDVRLRHATAFSPVVISGCIGPRGDGTWPATSCRWPTPASTTPCRSRPSPTQGWTS